MIEPHSEAFYNLTHGGKRKSDTWAVNACLSTKKFPEKVIFQAADVFSGIQNEGIINLTSFFVKLSQKLFLNFFLLASEKKQYDVKIRKKHLKTAKRVH